MVYYWRRGAKYYHTVSSQAGTVKEFQNYYQPWRSHRLTDCYNLIFGISRMAIRLNSDNISIYCKIFLWGLIIRYNRRGLLSASCMIIFYRFQTIKIRDLNQMKSYFRDDELEFWSNHLVEWQIVWAKNPKDRNKTDIKEKLLSIFVVTYIAWISFLILQVLSQIQTLHNC